jgi:SAM-dependent methyltransferase
MRSEQTERAKGLVPVATRRWIRSQQRRLRFWPAVGWVRFGSFRRREPISRLFGFDRGHCVDRYYIETFLSAHAADISGHVLEVGDATYTQAFGGNRVTKSAVLHARPDNPQATVIADLASAPHLESDTFDCIVLTQTLQFIYDLPAAVATLHRILKPGGVLLVTVPGISQISRFDMDRWGEYWRLTSLAAQRLFETVFPRAAVTVEAFGNVQTAIAFLHGLAIEDLKPEDLDYRDADYELLIAIRAVKSATP